MAIIISSGEIGSGIILENDTMTILEGGVAATTTVNSKGEISVSSGGTADSTVINNGGRLYVSIGGTANATTLKFGGIGDDAAMFAALSDAGAFEGATSHRIFEESNGLLA